MIFILLKNQLRKYIQYNNLKKK